MKRDTECEFKVTHTNKLTWYSSSIEVDYLLWFAPSGDYNRCRVRRGDRPSRYPKGKAIVLQDKEKICFVKYYLKNRNRVSDMRIMIYRYGPVDPESAIKVALSTFAAVGVLAASIF